MTHDPQAFDFFVQAVGVVHAPGARDQLRRYRAGVGDPDGVGKRVDTLLRRRLHGQVLGFDFHLELVLGHGVMVTGDDRVR